MEPIDYLEPIDLSPLLEEYLNARKGYTRFLSYYQFAEAIAYIKNVHYKNLPLYINHHSPAIREIVKRRLSCG